MSTATPELGLVEETKLGHHVYDGGELAPVEEGVERHVSPRCIECGLSERHPTHLHTAEAEDE